MKTRVLTIAFLFFGFIASAQETLTYKHDGVERVYVLYRPAGLPANAPLVFALHGYTSNALAMMAYSGFNGIADTAKFAVCYPQGSNASTNQPHWNARLSISTTDDIGFLSALAAHLQNKYTLNPNRTFICGHSNGGFMSYTMACEKPGVFKAIGNVAGTMSGYTWNNCRSEQGVPVLHIHGEADNTVPIDGSISAAGGWGGAPHVDSIVNYWASKNKCTVLDTVQISANTKAYYHTSGVNGNQVWYYKIAKHGHGWPTILDQSGIHASAVIWDFFRAYSGDVNNVPQSPYLGLKMYPNPASEKLYIEGEGLTGKILKMYSSKGELVYETEFGAGEPIDLSNFAGGTYVLRLNQRAYRLNIIH